jgi:hypothetical protein
MGVVHFALFNDISFTYKKNKKYSKLFISNPFPHILNSI